jgi:hypothetical protein
MNQSTTSDTLTYCPKQNGPKKRTREWRRLDKLQCRQEGTSDHAVSTAPADCCLLPSPSPLPSSMPSRKRPKGAMYSESCMHGMACVPLLFANRCPFFHTPEELSLGRDLLTPIGLVKRVCRHGFREQCPRDLKFIRTKKRPCLYTHVEDMPQTREIVDAKQQILKHKRVVAKHNAQWIDRQTAGTKHHTSLPFIYICVDICVCVCSSSSAIQQTMHTLYPRWI